MSKSIYEELKACTVRIVNKSTDNKYSAKGTGFFIGKNKILTCHHVIDSDKLKIIWNDEEYNIKILEEKKDLDLIFLEVNANNENFVRIDSKVSIRDKCYAFGFPNNKEENKVLAKNLQSNEDGMTFEVVHIDNSKKIKFKGEQFKEGFSGSPVLNEKTGKVCSIISVSRDVDEIKGGYGILLEKSSLFSYIDKVSFEIKKDEIIIGKKSFIIETINFKSKTYNLNVAIYPVTYYQYDFFCIEKRDRKKINSYSTFDRTKFPVVKITYDDAMAFVSWLSKNSKNNLKYTLLSSEEWEFIAYENITEFNICYEKNIATKIGTNYGKKGLYDFLGNIQEICRDKSIRGGFFKNNLNKIIKNREGITLLPRIEVGFRVIQANL